MTVESRVAYAPGVDVPAIVKFAEGFEGVGLRDVPSPEVLPGTAVVRILATGICGTDIHIAHDEYGYEAPVVMGHEMLGEVVAVGAGVPGDLLGAVVACETYYSTCEKCQWCRDGRRNLCPDRRSMGSFENGGFTAFVRMPAINLHPLPENVPGLAGVLSEPLACVTNLLLDPPVINAGERVLVTGPGAMGQVSAQVARAMGGRVLLSGLPKDAERLEIAASLGIETTVEAPESDAFDVVLECSGSPVAAGVAFDAVRRAGRYVQVGIFGKPVAIPFDKVLYKELVVTSGFASTPTSWRQAMQLLDAGLVDLAPLVTREIPIRDWKQAFESAAQGEGVKTVVVPSTE